MPNTPANRTRLVYARIAGGTCLINYALDIFGQVTTSRISGSGDFALRAQRILALGHLYRTALVSLTVGWVTVVVLAFALYVTLEPVNKRVAQLALFCRLGESFVGAVTLMLSFAAIKMYSAPTIRPDQLQSMLGIMQAASGSGFQIAMTFLGVGSTLFFYLFYRSGCIPRALAGFGVVASAIMLTVSIAWLIFPEYGSALQYGWGPIGLAEIATALWLLIKGVRIHSSSQPETS